MNDKVLFFDISLQKILIFLNFFLMGLILITYSINEIGKYHDLKIILSIQFLAIINIFFLRKKNPHPLTLFLGFYITFFYVLRVLTLLFFSHSNALNRLDLDISQFYKSILYILISCLFLYAGIEKFKFNEQKQNKLNFKIEKKLLSSIVCPICICSVLYFLYGIGCNLSSVNYISGVIGIMTGTTFLIPLSILCIVYSLVLKNKYLITFFLFILFFIFILSIYFGSRGILITIGESLLIIWLIIFSGGLVVNINFKLLASTILVVIFLSAFSYKVGTTIRQNYGGNTHLIGCDFQSSLIRADNEIKNLGDLQINKNEISDLLKSIFARIGYLDFSSEIILNEKYYSDIFTFNYYFESIVDNLLTPGWNLYDRARVGNSLNFVYNNYGEPKKSLIKYRYQSDQIGIFGEFYMLFGIFSFPFYYLIGAIFSKIYSIEFNNIAKDYLLRFFILIMFSKIINSYGFDWILFDFAVILMGLIFWSILIGISYFLNDKLHQYCSNKLNYSKT
jgi:hypothetical protein